MFCISSEYINVRYKVNVFIWHKNWQILLFTEIHILPVEVGKSLKFNYINKTDFEVCHFLTIFKNNKHRFYEHCNK